MIVFFDNRISMKTSLSFAKQVIRFTIRIQYENQVKLCKNGNWI